MKPIDHAWKETLELLEVPGAPGLYILGSYAQRVTIYSQQLRALSLIDALAGMGHLDRSSAVGVIGAGFGGCTVAAALTQLGVPVTTHFQGGLILFQMAQRCAMFQFLRND